MRKSYRILSLMLALLMTLSILVACDSGDKEDETKATEAITAGSVENSGSESETEFFPDVAKNNYGADFHLLIQPQSNKASYYWVKESDNDALSEAIYNRQQQIYNYLGVDIIATESSGHDQYGTPFITAVKNKDGSIDTLLSHAYMFLAKFIQGGYLIDFNTIDGINLDADYWDLDVMEGVAANDHLYLGYSDFRLAHTHAITFNKEMMDRYSDAFDESIYDMVRNYHWTLDQMISMANLVYTDTTSNGKTDDDIFGITGTQWVPFINFMQSSNIPLVDINEQGIYEVSVYNDANKERTSILVEKLSALSKSDSAWFKYKEEATTLISIYSGKTLLSIEAIVSLPGYLDYDVEFGVIPYPMFDETQKDVGYRSLDWGGWICIPAYVDNPQMVADTLEMIAFYSEDVTITFYEKVLGKQVADAPEDREMLDMIWDSICSDIGLTYSHIVEALDMNLYMLPTVTQANATEQLASYVKSYESGANKKLKGYFSALK
ncbi:MAG: hypothetical protein IJY39_14385 [Clostridia bacterium]|nr:hypothetical protein [Clostridia bacterium]